MKGVMSAKYSCEICGRPIFKPRYYIVDGVKMILCADCAKFGEPVSERKAKIRKVSIEKEARAPRVDKFLEKDWEVVDDYHIRIRNAREKMGLKIEEFAMKIGEPVSFLRKVEAGKIIPPDDVIEKIERFLKINLRKKLDLEALIEEASKSGGGGFKVTLGDIVIVKKKKKKK